MRFFFYRERKSRHKAFYWYSLRLCLLAPCIKAVLMFFISFFDTKVDRKVWLILLTVVKNKIVANWFFKLISYFLFY